MIEKLQEIEIKYHQIEEKLADPSVISDLDYYADLTRECKELKALVDVYHQYQGLLESRSVAQEMIDHEDPDLQEMGKMEMNGLEEKSEATEEEIKLRSLPTDPEDRKDVAMEMRAGR